MDDEAIDMACDWSDFRSDYAISDDLLAVQYKAFCAGWQAARHGSDRGVLR